MPFSSLHSQGKNMEVAIFRHSVLGGRQNIHSRRILQKSTFPLTCKQIELFSLVDVVATLATSQNYCRRNFSSTPHFFFFFLLWKKYCCKIPLRFLLRRYILMRKTMEVAYLDNPFLKVAKTLHDSKKSLLCPL
jgi:hypothetical protein